MLAGQFKRKFECLGEKYITSSLPSYKELKALIENGKEIAKKHNLEIIIYPLCQDYYEILLIICLKEFIKHLVLYIHMQTYT